MKSQLRHLVANALYPTKSYSLPSVCERYGLAPGNPDEAFNSKTRYVMSRLDKLSDEKVRTIAKDVVNDFPDDKLRAALEMLEEEGSLITDITRQHIGEGLNEFSLSGKDDLLEFLRKHWPSIDITPSDIDPFDKLSDDIYQHAIRNDDWNNMEILRRVGFLSCSQAKFFQFLEEIVHPIRRSHDDQECIIATLNPILKRDGYSFISSGFVSGYPIYTIQKTTATNVQPADDLISKVLISFDESGVHSSWQKALERRSRDPEGAITAAKSLLESVCKHIIDDMGESYGENDDLPRLYNTAAECLNLAPSQHTEKLFKSILGNCQSVVSNLAGLRNKLGDSHGQGKMPVKPQARHAELAVNLAGTMSMFLISTWNGRQIKS